MRLLRLDNLDHAGNEVERRSDRIQVDVVAVHGLNENNIDAWLDRSDPDNEVLWLRDLLPRNIQAVRVLSVGYNAYVSSFYGNGSVDRIQQHAHTLVAELQADRALEKCSQRPIIFVCHGLGGILVKKALAYSSTRTSKYVEHQYSIFASTFAILFFGTPHYGTDKANWFVSSNGDQDGSRESEAPMISTLEKDSEALQMITDHFASLMKQFHIFFFWEQVPTDFGKWTGFVVDESSAAPSIDNTERCGIYATHADMARFPRFGDSSYRTVLEALSRYCRDAPPVIARRWKQAEELLSRARSHEAFELTGTGFDVHNDNRPFYFQRRITEAPRNKIFRIPQAVSSIFTGRDNMSRLIKESLMTEEDNDHMTYQQRRFIIYGIGGSGKTQFSCKFAQDHRERFWAVFYIDATSMETAKHSFARIGRFGGLASTKSAGKHWLSHLEHPWLLIINNADDPNLDLPSLFPEGERGHILVTTRNPDFRIHGTVGSAEFKGLEEREALLLLLRAAGIRSPWDSSTEDNGNKITNALGYLALALIQAGALILQRICDVKDYLNFYDQCRRNAGTRRSLDVVDRGPFSVYSTWDLSLNSLKTRRSQSSRDAAQLLSIVAFYHFEHIRVDIFTRALDNRVAALQDSRGRSFSAFLLGAIRNRLQQPLLLPDFLRQEPAKLDPYRVRRALHELRSFSLISYDGRNDTFSLHPVVYAWARDRLGPGGQALWMHIARNILAESILLPPNDTGEVNEEYRRDILPHLDRCLAACPAQIFDFKVHFGGFKFPFAVLLRYTMLVNFREQVLMAAKFGYVYLERGHFNSAAQLLVMVKDALVDSRGIENEMTMRAMLALAGTYWGLGRLQEAVELQKTVVEARSKVLGAEHYETLLAMDQLGRSYWLNGQYHEALDLQTITTERMKNVLGPHDAQTLAAMDNLGITLGSWHRYSESMNMHRQVLLFRKSTLGPTHVDTLTTMNNLAMALFDLGQHQEANELMAKVYQERKSKLGKEHPWTLWALCNLAKIKTSMGALKDAEHLLVAGIAAAKRSLGDDHLGVLMGCGELTRVYSRQWRYDEANVLAHDTLRRLETSRGPDHPDTVSILYGIAQHYERFGELAKALDTCAIAVERVDMRLTRRHPLGESVYAYHASLRRRLQSSGKGHASHSINATSIKTTDSLKPRIPRSRTT